MAQEETIKMVDTLKELLPPGPIGAWPGYQTEDDEDDDDEWVVGIALAGIGGAPRKLRKGEIPSSYREIATVRGRKMAEALAAHLSTLK